MDGHTQKLESGIYGWATAGYAWTGGGVGASVDHFHGRSRLIGKALQIDI